MRSQNRKSEKHQEGYEKNVSLLLFYQNGWSGLLFDLCSRFGGADGFEAWAAFVGTKGEVFWIP